MIISIHESNKDCYDVFFRDKSGALVVDQCRNVDTFQRFKWEEIVQALKDDPRLLDALIPAIEPTPEQKKLAVIERLRELDSESIRALRAVQTGKSVKEDTDKLLALEIEAEDLRAKL